MIASDDLVASNCLELPRIASNCLELPPNRWRIPGEEGSFAHHRRAIHYREHFVTNVATAGGLLLLQKIGAGRYTVDELFKKKD